MTKATSPAPAGTRLDRLAGLILPPADRLGGRGTFAAPLGIILLASLATAVATQAWGWILAFPGTTSPPDAVRPLIWIAAVLTPVLALLRGGILALAAWAILVLIGSPPRARPLFSGFLYGEAILSLQGPALLLLLLLQGGPRSHGAPVPTGLDFFVPPDHRALFALAHGITPFHVAWVLFLAYAMAGSCTMSRGRGLAVATALWAVVVGFAVARAALTGGIA